MANQGQNTVVDVTEEQFSVEALRGLVPFRSITTTGEMVTLGQVGYTDYNNRAARQMYFRREGRDYKLGLATGQFRILDHYSVLQPLVEAGFQPALLKYGRGGAKLFALMNHPNIQFPDPITWDHLLYAQQGRVNLGMFLSVGVWIDARVGKAIHMVGGFFRTICTNGLVSKILSLGEVRFAHIKYEGDKAVDFTRRLIDSHSQELNLPKFSPRAMEWPAEVLHRYTEQGDKAIEKLPPFVQEPIHTLAGALPDWAQSSLVHQMSLVHQYDGPITVLDILNMVTNVSNERPTDRLYFKLEMIIGALMKVAAIGAFKKDIPFAYTMEL